MINSFFQNRKRKTLKIMKLLFIIESSSSSSLCSTVNDRSLAHALFDINSMLTIIGLGRRIPTQVNSPSTPKSRYSSVAHCSTNETMPKNISSIINKHGKQINSLSSIDDSKLKSQFVNNNSRLELLNSHIRPNSLIFSFSPSSLSSENSNQRNKILTTSVENEQLNDDDDHDKYYSAQSSKISTPMVHPIDSSFYRGNLEEKLLLTSILDIDNDDQQTIHRTKI